jgi:hypothetical protein
VADRLPAKSIKVSAASLWSQTKRLFYPLRDDLAAKCGPLQNIETAEPVAQGWQLKTERLRIWKSFSQSVQIFREPYSATPDAFQIDRKRSEVDIGELVISTIKHRV